MIGLRKINKNDKDYFLELNNDDDNRKWMRSDVKWDENMFKQILYNPLNRWFVVYDMDFNRNMNRVGLFTIYLYGKRMYIGIVIEKNFRRKGYARKAFKHYLEVSDKEKVDTWISCFRDQIALPMYEQLGYKEQSEEIVRGKEFIHMKREFKHSKNA
jgi:GNAT superfamily N-acetyltransferase